MQEIRMYVCRYLLQCRCLSNNIVFLLKYLRVLPMMVNDTVFSAIGTCLSLIHVIKSVIFVDSLYELSFIY